MNMREVSPVDEGAVALTRETIDTQIQILKSDALVDRTLLKLGWSPGPAPLRPGDDRPSAWRRALQIAENPAADPLQLRLAEARDSLKIRAQGQTRIVEILVDSSDPALASAFANTLANEYIDQNLESRWQMTQRTGEWLSKQLDEMKIKLERSEDRLQDYARRAGLMFTEKQGSVQEDKLRQVQEDLSRAQADRISRQSRFELAKTSPPETLADVLNDSTLRDYQAKLTDLRRRESELATTYTPEHASVRRVQAQIATLQAALNTERDAVLRRIRNDYDEAVRRESLLELNFVRQSNLVTEQSGKSIQYNILKREVDSNRQLYETMLERVRSAAVASALRASNVRVVDQAKTPAVPYKPRLALNSALGLLLGGFLGAVFVVVRERADRTLHEPADLAYHLNLPELGLIPKASTALSALCVSAVNPQTAVLAESFRSTLTSILFSSENGSRPRVLVLTSANPSEGKTTVAANLAEALAEVNQKVLLIDGDLRKPRLHEIFEVPKEHGLSDLLKDRAPLPESLNGSIRQTKVPNLFLLTSGEASAGATNLLYSERMSRLLELFEKEFDMVLIDTPPMLQIPDARILGRLSDAVILVVRAGRTTRDLALAAKQRLSEDGTKLLGTVLNYFDHKRAAGSPYYYDKYYRYQRYYE
ncbi:MAG: polysaccharide biosynthesis tyrosine autokinase [Bryobacteraceae bacterium]|nr:polysaccharide biosynthesis tyrosine autokinase [Bryobacteraceae bacterium]